MSNIALMGGDPNLEDDIDYEAVESRTIRALAKVAPEMETPEAAGRLTFGAMLALEQERRKNPRRIGSATPTPTPLPGVGTPPPRRDASCSPPTTTATQLPSQRESAQALPPPSNEVAPSDEHELSPEEIAQIQARADLKVDRALAKPPRLRS